MGNKHIGFVKIFTNIYFILYVSKFYTGKVVQDFWITSLEVHTSVYLSSCEYFVSEEVATFQFLHGFTKQRENRRKI